MYEMLVDEMLMNRVLMNEMLMTHLKNSFLLFVLEILFSSFASQFLAFQFNLRGFFDDRLF
jgi:hypothetical protein